MKDLSAAPYPRWWKERAKARRAELDAAVGRLREAVRSSPEILGALVFGSYAAGNVGPQSDLDIMLVTTLRADGDPGLRYARLVRALNLGCPCDLLIYEPEEFERLSAERAFFARARRGGIWIDATTSA